MAGSFLEEPPVSAPVQALYDEDLAEDGYVSNVSRLWAHQPETLRPIKMRDNPVPGCPGAGNLTIAGRHRGVR
jgi:hypothetical protein